MGRIEHHALRDTSLLRDTRPKTRTGIRGVAVGALVAVGVVGGYFVWRWLNGEIGDDGLIREPRMPIVPRSPDDPYTDINGKPILYPLRSDGVSEFDTTMTGEGDAGHPPKNSPDALKLRKEDPLEYYKRYYPGVTRGKLGEIDNALYKRLARAELLEHVPTRLPYGANPLELYNTKYAGLTRGALSIADPVYYNYLRYHDLLDNIPLDPSRYPDGSLQYFRENYMGLTRGQLQAADPALYMQMQREGTLQEVPVIVNGGDDPYKYYQENYAGLTKEQLREKDVQLYWVLRRWGLIDLLPK